MCGMRLVVFCPKEIKICPNKSIYPLAPSYSGQEINPSDNMQGSGEFWHFKILEIPCDIGSNPIGAINFFHDRKVY